MKTFDGLKDCKTPTDYHDPNWAMDFFLAEPDEPERSPNWMMVVGAIPMLIGIGIGFWFGSL